MTASSRIAGSSSPALVPATVLDGRIGLAFTVRNGGTSAPPWGAPDGGGLNLGDHVGDDPAAVAANRARVAAAIGRPVRWVRQVHGVGVSDADADPDPATLLEADAQITTRGDLAIGILVADCLPVLLADRSGRIVGAAHAGWRGLAGGVVEATAAAMRARYPDAELLGWLGPCIGPTAFEVGDDVRNAFMAADPQTGACFRPGGMTGKWWADLPALARRRFVSAGISECTAGEPACTVSDPARYWSFRRDGQCGRMAGLIWRHPAEPGQDAA